MTAELSIRALIDRCLDRSEVGAVWPELIRRTDPILYLMARSALGKVPGALLNGLEPEDVANMVWLKLCDRNYAALRSFRGDTMAQWRAYTSRIVHNQVHDAARHASAKSRPQMVQPTAEQEDMMVAGAPFPGPGADSLVIEREATERFEKTLRRCWADRVSLDRDVLICQLHFEGGFSTAEISELPPINLGQKGVEKIITAARKLLKKHFGGPGARSRHIDDGSEFEGTAGPHADPDTLRQLLASRDTNEHDSVVRHLSFCADCRQEFSTLVRETQSPSTAELADYDQEVGGIEARIDRVMALLRPVRREKRSVPQWGWWLAAAAVAAMVWIGLPSGTQPHPLASVAATYPLDCVAPLRLAQEFAPEPAAISRGGAATDPADWRSLERTLQMNLAGTDLTTPQRVQTFNALGHLKLARSRMASARDHFLAAVDLDPHNAVALTGAAITYFHEGEPNGDDSRLAEAERLLAQVRPPGPHFERAQYNRVRVALARRDLEAARSLFEGYRALDGVDPIWVNALESALATSQNP